MACDRGGLTSPLMPSYDAEGTQPSVLGRPKRTPCRLILLLTLTAQDSALVTAPLPVVLAPLFLMMLSNRTRSPAVRAMLPAGQGMLCICIKTTIGLQEAVTQMCPQKGAKVGSRRIILHIHARRAHIARKPVAKHCMHIRGQCPDSSAANMAECAKATGVRIPTVSRVIW